MIVIALVLLVLAPETASAHAGHAHASTTPGLMIEILVFGSLLLLVSNKKSRKTGILLYTLAALVGSLIYPSQVAAADVSISSPSSSACVKGGTAPSIAWSGSGNAHYALYYRTDGGTPSYNGDTGGLVDHPIAGTSYSAWTAPTSTVSNAKLWVEGHDGGHTPTASNSVTISIDASAPTAVSVSTASKTSSSVNLSWGTSTDAGCKGLAGYKVYRDGGLIATLSSGTTTYADSGLSASTSYTYKVTAYDDFVSTDSSNHSVTTDAASSGGSGSSGGDSGSTVSPSPTPSSTSSAKTTTTTSKTTPSPSPKTSATPKTSPSPGTSPSASGTPSATPATTLAAPEVTISALAVDSMTKQPGQKLTLTRGQTLTLSGIGPVSSTMQIVVHSPIIQKEFTTDANGQWSVKISTADLTPGTHRIAVALKQADGVVGPEKDIYTFAVIGQSPPPKQSPVGLIAAIIALLLIGAGGAFYVVRKKKNTVLHPRPPLNPDSTPSS